MKKPIFSFLTIILLILSIPGYADFISNKGISSSLIINNDDNNSITEVICPDDFQICINSGILTLDMAYPTGGEYFGDGVLFNMFNPIEAGLGSHLIFYHFTDPDGNISTCSFMITVMESPEVLCPPGYSVCIAEPPFALTGATPEGGIYMINGVVSDTLDPTVVGIGNHQIGYCYSDSSGCAETNTYILQVITLPFLELGETDTLLSDDFEQNVPKPYQLMFYGTGYSTVEWTSNGTGTFNNPNLSNPVYTFSQQDISAEGVTFTLTAQSTGLCSTNVSGSKMVAIPSQLIDIPAGWSGISSYINPYDPDIEHVIAPCNGNLIVQVSLNGIYWGEQSINTLISWSTEVGYKVKYEQACCLPLFGSPVTWPSTVHLDAGINYIPVHSRNPVKLTDVFGADTNMIILLIDIYSMQVFSPSFGEFNTLEYLEPGIGYMAYVSDSINITYPIPTKNMATNIYFAKREPFQVRNQTIWNDVINTGSMHFISIDKTALSDLDYGDYIGAFTSNGRCSGMVEYIGNAKTIIPVFGDDPSTTEKDGMSENEFISIRLYSHSSGIESDLSVIYDPAFPDDKGIYVNFGLSGILRITTGTASENNLKSEKLLIFPNPAKDYLIIQSDAGICDIKLSNFYGQDLFTERVENSNECFLNLANYGKGVYFIEVKTNKGWVTNQRILIQ